MQGKFQRARQKLKNAPKALFLKLLITPVFFSYFTAKLEIISVRNIKKITIMKKKFLLTLLFCMVCAVAMAGSMKVVDGNKKVFKAISGYALLEIDWSETSYDGRMTLQEKYGDFEPYAAASRSGFIQDFNQDCRSVKIVDDESKANYKILIKIDKVDQYIKVTGFIPGPATKIWGTLSIIDLQSNKTLTVVKIDECNGGASPSPLETFSDSFEALGEYVAGLR